MNEFLQGLLDPRSFPYWGLAGTVLVLVGCFIPALAYTGKNGEKYSPLNHFISELGERSVSRRAAIFNNSLIVTGILYAVFMIQFGRFFSTAAIVPAAAAGVFSSVACILVGFFPMDDFDKHLRAAMSFFYGGLASILLFGIASLLDRQRRLPWVFILFAVAVALIFSTFLFLPKLLNKKRQNGEPGATEQSGTADQPKLLDRPLLSTISLESGRPAVWMLPILEWLCMLSIIGWIASVSLYFIISSW